MLIDMSSYYFTYTHVIAEYHSPPRRPMFSYYYTYSQVSCLNLRRECELLQLII